MAEDMEAVVVRLQDCLDGATKASVAVDTGDLRALLSAHRKMVEALEPFAAAFEAARERYIRRYRDNAEIGAANFDKMPDEWPMDLPVPFRMGQYRKARAVLTGSPDNVH